MGTKPQGPGQSSQPAAGAPSQVTSNRPQPLSVAPQGLAEHLDHGWGDDPDTLRAGTLGSATALPSSEGADDDWDLPSAEALARASIPPTACRAPTASAESTSAPLSERRHKRASATVDEESRASFRPSRATSVSESTRPATASTTTGTAQQGSLYDGAGGVEPPRARPIIGFPAPHLHAETECAPPSMLDRCDYQENPAAIEPTESVIGSKEREPGNSLPSPIADTAANALNITDEVVGMAAAPIDITIEPSFPQVVDPDSPILAPPTPPSKVESVRPSAPSVRLSALDAGTSMSPVTTSAMGVGKSRLWLLAAAAIICVGATWGIVGVQHRSKSPARRDLSEPSLLVVAAQTRRLATVPVEPVAIAESASAEAEAEPIATQIAAQPPPTSRVDRAETAPVTPRTASAATKALTPSLAGDSAISKKSAKPAALEAQASASNEQSSQALNAPIVPAGVVDPRAFPSKSPATVASKVHVEVNPPDSKIAVRGRTAAPPYVFDVPKGERVVLEVARSGFITRRIVLDGSREFVRIGMIPEPKPREPVEPENPAQLPHAPTEP